MLVQANIALLPMGSGSTIKQRAGAEIRVGVGWREEQRAGVQEHFDILSNWVRL
jgi:hypothetical protein